MKNEFFFLNSAQCCGSGIFIPDPDFYPFRILDPGSKNSNKREGRKKIVVIPFLKLQSSQNGKLFYFCDTEEKI
jgi:hypothetical protein